MSVNQTVHEANNCKLISGTFETLVQVGLGIVGLSVLVLKRAYEKPQRPFQVWAYDASKQAIGAGVAHAANLFIAIMLVKLSKSDDAKDECSFYFINFTLDTSLGVLLNWVLLRTTVAAALHFNWTWLQVPGYYGNPIRTRVWLTQLLSWIAIVLTAKLVIARFIYAFSAPLNDFGNWLFDPLSNYPKVELLFVMVACPCLMNALQFWITDNFLKKPAKVVGAVADEKTPLV
ncbi:hypothetical protein H310_03319 [Aphanomyces invadans]|uniref:Uncharacterized protein n=1 Tax=Aphanomyces invadans TaxID=157072 RepID=A0A024UH02_9STRA|nr:hypothetical protein H310_03319 [Aphanomyces invadans]ETW05574.1 hypothetical protein H310_03319 [Aphanomyces invadans]|eukprot:XP_008865351.1 hypothetical protein H310_03319 [Aphanomyces invadans]